MGRSQRTLTNVLVNSTATLRARLPFVIESSPKHRLCSLLRLSKPASCVRSQGVPQSVTTDAAKTRHSYALQCECEALLGASRKLGRRKLVCPTRERSLLPLEILGCEKQYYIDLFLIWSRNHRERPRGPKANPTVRCVILLEQ